MSVVGVISRQSLFYFILFYFILEEVTLGFELRVSCLLGKFSTT
jgi:hypothetical protein